MAERIDTRYTPKLVFIVDEGVKKSLEVMRLLREVLPDSSALGSDDEPEPADTEPADTDADESAIDSASATEAGIASEDPSSEDEPFQRDDARDPPG